MKFFLNESVCGLEITSADYNLHNGRWKCHLADTDQKDDIKSEAYVQLQVMNHVSINVVKSKCNLQHFLLLYIVCCVFQPAFGCSKYPKAHKNVWKRTKKMVFVYFSKLVDMQKLVNSLKGYPEIVFFWLISYFFNVFSIFCTSVGMRIFLIDRTPPHITGYKSRQQGVACITLSVWLILVFFC